MNNFYDIIIRGATNNVTIFNSSELSEDYNFVLPPTQPKDKQFLIWDEPKKCLVWYDKSNVGSSDTDSTTFTLINGINGTTSPTQSASFLVKRGNAPSAEISWDETLDKWKIGVVGTLKNITCSYTTSIAQSNLTAKKLTVTHGLGSFPIVQIFDDSNMSIGMSVHHIDKNRFEVDFSNVGTITGTWNLIAIA